MGNRRLAWPLVLGLAVWFGCSEDPKSESGAISVTDLQVAGPYTCALYSDESVRCRGSYNGNGFEGVETVPFGPASSLGMAAAGASADGLCAVTEGSVQCIGGDDWNTVRTLDEIQDASLVRPPYVIRTSGRVTALTSDPPLGYVPDVETLDRVVDIAAIGDSACALHEDQTVTCVGNKDEWAVLETDALAGADDVIALSYNTFNYCAVRELGSVHCWGKAYEGAPTLNEPGAELDHATAVGAGLIHQCAVQDGAAWCWGFLTTVDSVELFGDTTVQVPGDLEPIVKIDGGWYHTCALTEDSRVFCVGGDTFSQSGAGDSTELVEAEGF